MYIAIAEYFSKQDSIGRSWLLLAVINNNNLIILFLQRKRTKSAVIEDKIKQIPMKRWKVNREAADMTCKIGSKSEPGKKVISSVYLFIYHQITFLKFKYLYLMCPVLYMGIFRLRRGSETPEKIIYTRISK